MKRVLISTALSAVMLTAGIPVIAQTSTPDNNTTQSAPAQRGWKQHGRRGAQMGERMMQQLNLTQQQQDQLKSIFQSQRQKARTINQNNSLTQEQKKAQLQALRQETHSQVSNILTPEQQQQWAQMREQRATQQSNKMQARMAEKLNLTQQQQDQLKPILDSQREKAQAIRQDNSLTQEQKNQQLQSLRQETQGQMNAILTPEQQQQMQQMQQNFKQHRHGRNHTNNTQPVPQG